MSEQHQAQNDNDTNTTKNLEDDVTKKMGNTREKPIYPVQVNVIPQSLPPSGQQQPQPKNRRISKREIKSDLSSNKLAAVPGEGEGPSPVNIAPLDRKSNVSMGNTLLHPDDDNKGKISRSQSYSGKSNLGPNGGSHGAHGSHGIPIPTDDFEAGIRAFQQNQNSNAYLKFSKVFQSFSVIEDIADMNRFTLVFRDVIVEQKYELFLTNTREGRYRHLKRGTYGFLGFVVFVQLLYYVLGMNTLDTGLPETISIWYFIGGLGAVVVFLRKESWADIVIKSYKLLDLIFGIISFSTGSLK